MPLQLLAMLWLEPLPWESGWLWTLAPLVVGVAIVYKALKAPSVGRLPVAAAWMAGQLLALYVLAAVAIWLVLEML